MDKTKYRKFIEEVIQIKRCPISPLIKEINIDPVRWFWSLPWEFYKVWRTIWQYLLKTSNAQNLWPSSKPSPWRTFGTERSLAALFLLVKKNERMRLPSAEEWPHNGGITPLQHTTYQLQSEAGTHLGRGGSARCIVGWEKHIAKQCV